VRMEKEAEERAAKARAMPNSLLSERAIAVAEKSKPWADFDCAVPKTSGELRLHVKHSHKKGLFIHGFKPGSLAEAQGILQQGDEVLEVDGYDVHGKSLQVLVGILKAHTADVVQMRFRRHKYKM
jgi:S1-C subfamily serine protease